MEKIKTINKYKIFSTSINQLIKDKILEVPNYVKIDVDGLEHLILEEADEILNSDKLQEILIEINENYDTQFKKIIKVMEYNKFKIYKKHSSVYAQNSAFDKSYNYILKKKFNSYNFSLINSFKFQNLVFGHLLKLNIFLHILSI